LGNRGSLVEIATLIAVAHFYQEPLVRLIASHSEEAFTLALFAFVLLVASTAQLIGLSEAVGAFLAGLVLGGTTLKERAAHTLLPFQTLFAALFFGLLFFAAFLSVVAALEVLVTAAVDSWHWSRPRAALIFCAGSLVAGTISMVSLDYITTSDLFWGSTMQPIGSAMALIGLAWIVGRRKSLEAVNEGNDGSPIGKWWYYWIKYVIPSGILVILALGLPDLFGAFFG